jgi:hypothetical protein
MKEKIQEFLCIDGNWKKFIGPEAGEQKDAKILSVNVTTFMLEEERVHFDVSLVYSVNSMGQKLSYESGIGLLDKKGNITEVRNNVP